MGDILRFPTPDPIPDQPKCKVCGAPLELLRYERPREKCFCCERTIPMFGRPCPDCEGAGVVEVHVCRDEGECRRSCTKKEHCMTCRGTGQIG